MKTICVICTQIHFMDIHPLHSALICPDEWKLWILALTLER